MWTFKIGDLICKSHPNTSDILQIGIVIASSLGADSRHKLSLLNSNYSNDKQTKKESNRSAGAS